MTDFTQHEPFIRECYRLAAQAVERGNHPFGALLVLDGAIVASAENTVHTLTDASRHAELNLIQQAASQLTPEQIARCTLYTSTEPCMMCSGAIYWSGISQVVYGCSEAKLAEFAGDDFLAPCREVFARGKRPMMVIGPVLEAEGAKLHQNFW